MPISRHDPDAVLEAFAAKGMYPEGQSGPVKIPGPAPAVVEHKPGRRDFVAPSFTPPGTWVVPCWLASEANTGGARRAAIGRKQAVKSAIWRAIGPWWNVFGPAGDLVRAGQASLGKRAKLPLIRVTRLGGRGLDRTNLFMATKSVEDALAILMGCADAWQAWRDSFYVTQLPGVLWGVKVEIFCNRNEAGPPL